MPDRNRLGLLLLSAGAGAVNVMSVTVLDGAVSGVITGDLAVAADDLTARRATLVAAPVVVITAFLLGTAVWSVYLRDAPAGIAIPHRRGLVAEAFVLALVPLGLASAGGSPSRPLALVLLGCAALAMGAQSAIGLRGGVSTTFMTGSLASAVHDVAVCSHTRASRDTFRRAIALVLGAVIAGLLVPVGWWAVAGLPVVLIALALIAFPPVLRTSGEEVN